MDSLLVVSPIDGRYRARTSLLSPFFSEEALVRYRIQVELHYLLFLSKKRIIKKLNPRQRKRLLSILENFNPRQAQRVKEIEAVTNHDVKSVEYYLRGIISPLNLGIEDYLHFALTSEDINNLAISLSIKEGRDRVILPVLKDLVEKMAGLADTWKRKPMLARTHGQPAVPTTVGKELINFAIRLDKEVKTFSLLPIEGKLNGAVGNFNAHVAAFPQIDWAVFSQDFIASLGLEPNLYTTQILPTDSYVKIFQSLILINQILIGFNQDVWRYISDDYFRQAVNKGEVGSSTMPQKVNPIDFENSEGNLGMANAVFGFLGEKLTVSRLQRDLSDSTVKRNIGVAFAHSLLGYQSCLKGLGKIALNEKLLKEALLDHWEIITEGIQTILRTEGDSQAYERLKDFAQGKRLGPKKIVGFVKTLDIGEEAKARLLSLTPLNYLGLAEKLVEKGLKVINFEQKEDDEEE